MKINLWSPQRRESRRAGLVSPPEGAKRGSQPGNPFLELRRLGCACLSKKECGQAKLKTSRATYLGFEALQENAAQMAASGKRDPSLECRENGPANGDPAIVSGMGEGRGDCRLRGTDETGQG
jgi:hypothetical protein